MSHGVEEFKKRISELCSAYQILVDGNNRDFIDIYEMYLEFYNAIKDLATYTEIEDCLHNLEKSSFYNDENFQELNQLFIKYKKFESLKEEIFLFAKAIKDKYPNIDKSDLESFKFIKKIFNRISFGGLEGLDDYIEQLKNNINLYTLDEKRIIHRILEIYNQIYASETSYIIYNETLANKVIDPQDVYLDSSLKSIINGKIAESKKILFIKKIKTLLEKRTLMLADSKYEMDYRDVELCSQLDNRVVKDLIERNELVDWEKEYLRKLNNEMLRDPYLIMSIPLGNLTTTTLNEYKEYLPDIEEIINNTMELYNDAKRINDKYVHREKISEEENLRLFKFLNYHINIYRVDRAFEYELFVNDLMNKEEPLSYDQSSFLTKYLGYKKCLEDGLENVEISFAKFPQKSNKSRTQGICHKGIIFIDKDLLNNCVFNIENKESFSLLKVLFHELRHSFQSMESNRKKSNQVSYCNAIFDIITYYEPRDYKKNYYEYYSELDADKMAYNEIIRVLDKYKYASGKEIKWAHKKTREIRRREMFTNRKGVLDMNDFFAAPTAMHEKKYTDMYFRENPKRLDTYPLFKKLYAKSGKPRKLDDFLSNYHKGQEQYYYNFFTALIYEGENLCKENISNKTQREKLNMIRNLINIFSILIDRLFEARRIVDGDISDYGHKKLICDNILLDIKIGKRIIKMYKDILSISPELEDDIIKVDEYLIDDFNDFSEWFYEIQTELKDKGIILVGNLLNAISL